MNPNNQSQSGGFAGTSPSDDSQRKTTYPAQQSQPGQTTPLQQEAAVNVLRSQIENLYGASVTSEPDTSSAQPAPAPAHSQIPAVQPQISQTQLQQNIQDSDSPYDRSAATQQHVNVDKSQWKDYHSAWQDYYQKYYEAYYDHQDKQKESRRQQISQELAVVQQPVVQPAPTPGPTPLSAAIKHEEESVSSNQAMQELRSKLLDTVKSRAEKVKKSRHFMPIAIALCVVLVFVFIQYNRVFMATVNAYVSPGSIDPQNIIVNPEGGDIVGEDPRLIIPKINVDVPVTYDISPAHESQMAAMENGVAHFKIPGASSKPGEKGNTVISGHSSNDLFDRGDYKFIFAQLDKLNEGDTIYANYGGKRYAYAITMKEVVKPSQIDKLVYPTDKPILTLITCTPLGTSLNRLLVTAEQVSPDPNKAASAPDAAGSDKDAAMPGNSATLLERLFGRR